MKKYEEDHYRFENIKGQVYPWIKDELKDSLALNGKRLSDETVAISFLGDLKVLFAVKRGEDSYEILQDNMIAPDMEIEQLYHAACENLVRDVEFVIGNTWYGAYAIIADGIHEASSLCFRHIWNVCVEKLKDDLIIMVPAKDTVIFAPASQKKVVDEMIDHGEKAFEAATDRISNRVFIFSQSGKELSLYEA
ncbi:MAG: hypothetical protein ACI4S2_03165 [Lachnospiraceae bacterium]